MVKRPSTSKQWARRQDEDPFVKQRDAQGLRSRAAFKLKEIQTRDRLIHKGATVIDLGSSPGGWSQVAAAAAGRSGNIIGVDVLTMAPLEGVHFIQGDCRDPLTLKQIRDLVGGRNADLVMSDIAPNITGIRDLDEANFLELAEMVQDVAGELLKAGGSMLIKLFQFPGTDSYVRDLKSSYASIARRKPDSSRKTSREFYVVAKGFVI